MADQSQQRIEPMLLAAIVVVSIWLRVGFPSSIAIEHFDEGVYASTSNFFFWLGGRDDFEYPDRYLYAPPFIPWSILWSINLMGPSQLSPMLPTLLASIATTILIWWVVRSWFGPAPALAAATLATFNDVHLLYSRTALTDVMLCFWLLLAVYLIREALTRKHLVWTFAAGLATGLAWWTKYNGWLPLAISLAALIPWSFLRSPSKTASTNHSPESDQPETETSSQPTDSLSVAQCFIRWTTIFIISIVIWSPALYQIQTDTRGGYAKVSANHRRYLVSLVDWPEAFQDQIDNHRFLDGWLSCCGLAIAFLVLSFFTLKSNDRFTCNGPTQPIPTILVTILLLAIATAVGSSVLLGLLAAVGITWSLISDFKQSQTTQTQSQTSDRNSSSLALWMLAAWFVSMSVATPMYYPFPRLTLPWLVAAWLGTSALFNQIKNQQLPALNSLPRQVRSVAACIILATSLFLLFQSAPTLNKRGVVAWQPRTGLKQIADQLARDAQPISAKLKKKSDLVDSVIYVYAEPAMLFHLGSADLLAQPISNLDFVLPTAKPRIGPTFLVTGPHAHRSQLYEQQMKEVADKFELVKTYSYSPSDLVRLNQAQPSPVNTEAPNSSWCINLYLAK